MNYKEFADKVYESGKLITSIPIVIPSYQRPEPTTLKWICKLPDLNAYVFVRSNEYDAYHVRWKEYPNIHIIKLYNVTNIGETRKAIMYWCLSHEIDEAFQLDDDVTGIDYLYEHTSPKGKICLRQAHLNEGFKITGANPVAFVMWEALIRLIEHDTGTKVALCGIPYRIFSWGLRKELYGINCDLPVMCTYINYRFLLENGITYRSSSEVGWEDLCITIEAMRKGLNVAKAWNITFTPAPMGLNSGGCNGTDPEKTLWERSKKNSEIFMKNVAKGDPALCIKEKPKYPFVGVKCYWNKLKIDKEQPS